MRNHLPYKYKRLPIYLAHFLYNRAEHYIFAAVFKKKALVYGT